MHSSVCVSQNLRIIQAPGSWTKAGFPSLSVPSQLLFCAGVGWGAESRSEKLLSEAGPSPATLLQTQMSQKDTAQRFLETALFRWAGSHGLDHVYRLPTHPWAEPSASPTSQLHH